MAAEMRSSNFAQTCNLLSQYLKEKRSQYLHGDAAQVNFGAPAVKPSATTMNLLNNMEASPVPAPAAAPAPAPAEAASPVGPVAEQPRSAPMTIFYGGQVLVFSDLSAEAAKEIMGLATKGIASSVVSSTSESNNAVVVPQQAQAPIAGADLPIARRASLHKFLAKRKERVTAVSPYQMDFHHQRAAASSSKADEHVEGSKQLELRL